MEVLSIAMRRKSDVIERVKPLEHDLIDRIDQKIGQMQS